MSGIGRIFIFLGILLVALGLFFTFGGKIPFLGQLPGDINFGSEKFRVYFPIVTSVVLSLLLTIILNVIFWLSNK
jgi:hypothetical protein